MPWARKMATTLSSVALLPVERMAAMTCERVALVASIFLGGIGKLMIEYDAMILVAINKKPLIWRM